MTLREKQASFAHWVAVLILKAESLGYEVTLGDAYRDPRCPYGHPDSLHGMRLAVDLNLFKDGRYIRDDEGHKELGQWWQAIGGTWGGDFNDWNHYSFAHGGMV